MTDKQPDWADEMAEELFHSISLRELEVDAGPLVSRIAAALRETSQEHFKRGEAYGLRRAAAAIDDGASVAADKTIGPFLREMAKLFHTQADKIEKGME
jgi:hypothetical protein